MNLKKGVEPHFVMLQLEFICHYQPKLTARLWQQNYVAHKEATVPQNIC